MTERFRRLRAAYEAAIAEPDPARREALLVESCAGDEAMLAELRQMLARPPAPDFLEVDEVDDVGRPAAAPLQRLGEFELVREIGSGGSGTVWLARQPALDRQVALKVLRAGSGAPLASVDRFHREALAVAGLSHPHIVPVYADGHDGDVHWFAMQLVDGHGLDVELRLQCEQRPNDPAPLLPPYGSVRWYAAVARLCADAADALQKAHEAGVVHRDVKPPNLLLDRGGRVLVADFGIARDARFGSLTETGTIAGTWHYMSPEQARVARFPVDHRTDVYSLGVVLYELLTLHRPFEGSTSVEVFDQLRRVPPRPVRKRNRDVPRDLETICMAAMAARPDERYQSAKELRDDLERFLAHVAIVRQPPSWWARSAARLRRHRVAVGVVALVATAAVTGAFVQSSVAAADRRTALHARADELLRLDDLDLAAPDRLAIVWREVADVAATAGDSRTDAVRARLLTYRDRLLADSRRLLAPRDGDPEAEPASTRELVEGLNRWVRAAAVFVGDERVAAARPVDPFAGEVTLSVLEGAGADTPVRVSCHRIDGATGLPGPGSVALLAPGVVQLPAGHYRFVVASPGGGAVEFERTVVARRRLELRVPRRSAPPSTAGMVFVRAGELHLPADAAPSGLTGRAVAVAPFWIDRTEVSVGEYRRFMAATGRSAPFGLDRLTEAHDALPVVNVAWDDAVAYAEWVGKRLPTMAEWMLAAYGSGARPRRFPWGDTGMHGNVGVRYQPLADHEAGFAAYLRHAVAVDAHPDSATPEGVLELFGNVEEWCGSLGVDLGATGLVVRPDKRYVLGHSFYASRDAVRAGPNDVQLKDHGPAHFHHVRGFRCARSAES